MWANNIDGEIKVFKYSVSLFFYYGSEGTTANASEWSDRYSLHGALGHVAYDAPTESNPEAVSDLKMTGNGLTFSGVSIKHT